MQKCLAGNIPNVVELLPQREITDSSHATVIQEKSWVEKQSAPVQVINESSTGKCRSNRTRIVIQKPIGFVDKSSSGKNVSMNDVFMNDMSTVGMDSINPVENDYWCQLDDFLVSGDLDDLCPDQDVCNNGKYVSEERIVFQDVGHITARSIETPNLSKDNNLSFDSQV